LVGVTSPCHAAARHTWWVQTAPGALPAPLLGREADLRAIDLARDAAARGSGGLVTIAGEAGIGKTRLAEEAVARAVDAGFAAAWGSGWPEGGAPPLWPWQHVLGQLGATEAARLLDGQDAGGVDPERFSRFREVALSVVQAGRSAPTIVVLDDAHHADAAALVLARFVARSVRAARVLMVVTYREPIGAAPSDLVAAALSDLSAEGTRLTLAGLDDQAVRELLGSAGTSADPGQLAELQVLTGGNPLLLHEAIARKPQGAAVRSGVRRLVRSRLSTFDPGELDVLATAALLGAGLDEEFLARVAATDLGTVRAVRRRGLAAGILRPSDAEGFTFAHGLFREALLADWGRERARQAHERAADELSQLAAPADAERVSRIASHRLAAAESGGALWTAVEASRVAARAHVERFAYEPAADLLRRARDLFDRRADQTPSRVLLELAHAELHAGRLRTAREACRAAAAAVASSAGGSPPEEDDADVLAEAAIGLGGIWVLEHRHPVEMEQFHRLLRDAQEGLGERRPDLRHRIAVRLAAEAVYTGTGSIGAVRAAVEQVRGTGDRRALAEALSLLHHTLLGPEFADERLGVAKELVEVASSSGEPVLTLMGVLWRTVDLFLLGDPAAEVSLAELRQRADALRVQAVLFVVAALDVMLALRQGRVEEAETGAAACLKMGLEVGDADAPEYYGAQLLAVRWLQGRSEEILPVARDLAHSVGVTTRDRAYLAAHAALAADAGPENAPEARRVLDRVLASGLKALESSSNWLVTFFTAAEAAALLGDAAAAAGMYEVLLPYARLPIMASIGVVCFGSVERSLGVTARAARRLDEAVAHLERAVDACARLGNRPVEELSRADLALTLLARKNPGDAERAEALIDRAVGTLRSLGLPARADRIAEEAARARSATGGRPNGLTYAGNVREPEAGGETAVAADSRAPERGAVPNRPRPPAGGGE
jgi:tetratricopeptide (TPR) repeat protein